MSKEQSGSNFNGLSAMIEEIRADNAHLQPEALQALIDSAVEDVRRACPRLSPEQWEAFQAELGGSPRPLPCLDDLLKKKSVFD
jgi:hypothetical protein